jgi:hypothetical protein
MNKKEIMEALTAINLDLIMAEQLITRAGFKHKAVLSQLAIDWKDELESEVEQPAEIRQVRRDSFRAVEHTHPAGAGETQSPVSAKTEPRDPLAGSSGAAITGVTSQGIDFSNLSLKDVPQSPASRVDAVLNTPTPGSGRPTAVAPDRPRGPTREVPQHEQRRAPQPENPARTPDPQREKYLEQLGHFTGNGSLFSRHLSPSVLASGKGFLKPDVAGLEQYSDDVLQLTPQRMADWPTGFYRDRQTSEVQFMLVSARGVVVVPMLPKSDQIPMVALAPISGQSQLMPVNELPMMDLLMLKESVEASLKKLSDSVVVVQ